MNSPRARFLALVLVVGLWSAQAGAQGNGGLVHLDGPRGGDIVYGPVTGVSAAPAAMGAVLRMLHQRYGVRPEVGRVVDVGGTGSSTLRFSVRPPQGAPVAGMIVLAQGAQGYEAAVVSDDPQRLATSFNPMLQALAAAWHPAPAGGGAPGASGPAAPLRTLVLNDRSARVGLPDGWRVSPESAGGTIFAYGPNGEFAALGAPYLVLDPRAPSGPGSVYAQALRYPYGQPLGRTFADLARMTNERTRAPFTPVQVQSEVALADQGGMHCARLQGEGGIAAGRGPGRFDTVFCVAPPAGGSWMALAYHVAAPTQVAAAERATLLAIRSSFMPDNAVIQRQAGQLAAPVIAQIREIGRQATARAAEADRVRIDSRNRFEAYGNTRDRLAQGFTNYQRDQSVIVDRDTNGHATTWNSVADEMVRNNPQRYEIVDTPNYWKGVDY